MSFPARSSSMKLMPPDVPTPGMAGGGTANACASGSAASRRFSDRMMASAVRPFGSRLSQSSSVRKYCAVLVVVSPITTVKFFTPGVSFRMASIWSQTAAVRCIDAAGGSWTLTDM